ncbi:collagen alpha-2(I) chain-like isoform X2 [Gopherus flavomarginatus]|uniref:collagen alpha-2(I) chain-like isoform X2 n=1 Tax=Gopherus flavomarginatus TaxID=286002 RepID=UPI0021CBD959|nr:collagen alpha-2(I) chain-like isoform X2 [Gopherus flavomarginatus]
MPVAGRSPSVAPRGWKSTRGPANASGRPQPACHPPGMEIHAGPSERQRPACHCPSPPGDGNPRGAQRTPAAGRSPSVAPQGWKSMRGPVNASGRPVTVRRPPGMEIHAGPSERQRPACHRPSPPGDGNPRRAQRTPAAGLSPSVAPRGWKSMRGPVNASGRPVTPRGWKSTRGPVNASGRPVTVRRPPGMEIHAGPSERQRPACHRPSPPGDGNPCGAQ